MTQLASQPCFSIDAAGWCQQARRCLLPITTNGQRRMISPCWWCMASACRRGSSVAPLSTISLWGDSTRGSPLFCRYPSAAGLGPLPDPPRWRAGAVCAVRRTRLACRCLELAGREACNDFSIGIELEGTDETPYTEAQYRALAGLTRAISERYPAITHEKIVGHCDIAPGRKTDPGASFQWDYYRQLLNS